MSAYYLCDADARSGPGGIPFHKRKRDTFRADDAEPSAELLAALQEVDRRGRAIVRQLRHQSYRYFDFRNHASLTDSSRRTGCDWKELALILPFVLRSSEIIRSAPRRRKIIAGLWRFSVLRQQLGDHCVDVSDAGLRQLHHTCLESMACFVDCVGPTRSSGCDKMIKLHGLCHVAHQRAEAGPERQWSSESVSSFLSVLACN